MPTALGKGNLPQRLPRSDRRDSWQKRRASQHLRPGRHPPRGGFGRMCVATLPGERGCAVCLGEMNASHHRLAVACDFLFPSSSAGPFWPRAAPHRVLLPRSLNSMWGVAPGPCPAAGGISGCAARKPLCCLVIARAQIPSVAGSACFESSAGSWYWYGVCQRWFCADGGRGCG